MDGIDLATPAGELVIGHATDEEWKWIEARVKQAIEALKSPYSDWSQEALVGFLAQRFAAEEQDAKVDDLIFEMGTPRQQAFLLVQQGRFAEAVAIAQDHFSDLPGLVTQFADALVEAGGGQAARAYIVGLLDTRGGSTYLSWLAHYAEQQGELTTALDWWRQSIRQAPSFRTYLTIRDVAQRLGMWDQTRRDLLAEFETNQAWHILIEIALDEEDVPWALELLPKLRGWYSSDLELRVAQAAETNYPQAALDIYRRRAESLINRRGRDNYHTAAELLTRVRKLYRQQDAADAWQQYLAALREDHKRLPALQDELNKAGLS
jgi:hypothetical protein